MASPDRRLDLAWADADYLYYHGHRTPRPAGHLNLTAHGDVLRYSTWEGSLDHGRGVVYEWNPKAGGDPKPIAESAVATPVVEGDMVGWMELVGPDQVRFVMRVGDAEYRSDPMPGGRWSGGAIAALDDSGMPTMTYFVDRKRVWSWNGTDRPTTLSINEEDLLDRENGVTAVLADQSTEDTWTIRFVDSDGREINQVGNVWRIGELDDSGERFLTQTGQSPGTPTVIDVATGDTTPLDIDGQSNLGLPMTWDADGDAIVATRPEDDDKALVDLMTCDPTSGACVTVAEDVSTASDIVLEQGTGVSPSIS